MDCGSIHYSSLYNILECCRHTRSITKETIRLPSSSTSISIQTIEDIGKLIPFLPDIGKEPLVLSAINPERSAEALEQVYGDGDTGEVCVGSPLKLHTCVDYADVDRHLAQGDEKVMVLSKDRHNLFPLPSKLARECLSAITLSSLLSDRSVLCICDPTDSRDGTLVIGYHCSAASKKLTSVTYQELSFNECKFTRLLNDYKMQSVELKPNLHIATHAEYHLLSTSSTNLLNPDSSEEVNTLPSQSTVTINVDWVSVNSLVIAPPADSVAILNINVACGDKSSMVYCLYEDLQYLLDLAKGLSSGKIIWPEVERSAPPMELVIKLLQSQSYVDENEDTDQGESVQINSIVPRKNPDFTDRLWSVLTGCQSYTELLEVMKFVVDSVSNKRCSPLMVSSSNTNHLAKWIYSQQLGKVDNSASLDLGSLQALIYFIEIGIEKITKDYVHTYLGNFSGLVTADKLEKFTKTNFTVQEKLNHLSKLHTVLELSALLHSYIRLPLATVRSATASALEHLSINHSLPKEGFKLPTTVASISDIITSQTPEVWEATVGEDDKMSVRVTKVKPDHSIVLPSKGDSMEEILYCTVVREQDITDDFL